MAATRVCPDHILALFKDDATKALGRLRAVEWMKTQVQEMRPGDEILIPHPETGALMSYTSRGYKTH